MNLDHDQENQRLSQIDPEDPTRLISRLTQAARIEGQRAWLELLRDREEWNLTPEWAQDEAIKAVIERLGETVSFLKTDVYKCGGRRHRLGTFEHRPTGIAFNLIPGGGFTMGSRRWDDSKPLREVSVKPLLVGLTPVTQAQWDRIGGDDTRRWHGEELPIEGVSWNDTKEWLSRADVGGRLALPSEAEWEYFCRAGTKRFFSFGDNDAGLKDYACYERNSGGSTNPVARLKPNAFGLYDVHGNVWEWCQDSRHNNYEGAPSDGSAWTSEGLASNHVLRGGAWCHVATSCGSAYRHGGGASWRQSFIGFRLCLRLD